MPHSLAMPRPSTFLTLELICLPQSSLRWMHSLLYTNITFVPFDKTKENLSQLNKICHHTPEINQTRSRTVMYLMRAQQLYFIYTFNIQTQSACIARQKASSVILI